LRFLDAHPSVGIAGGSFENLDGSDCHRFQGPNPVRWRWMGVSTGQVRFRQRTVRLELRIDTIPCSKLQDIDTPFPVSFA